MTETTRSMRQRGKPESTVTRRGISGAGDVNKRRMQRAKSSAAELEAMLRRLDARLDEAHARADRVLAALS